MKLLQRNSPKQNSLLPERCNHPLAGAVDPTDRELRELEAMLAKCPNCSQWMPGDGPIMAVLSNDENTTPKSSLDVYANLTPSVQSTAAASVVLFPKSSK